MGRLFFIIVMYQLCSECSSICTILNIKGCMAPYPSQYQGGPSFSVRPSHAWLKEVIFTPNVLLTLEI